VSDEPGAVRYRQLKDSGAPELELELAQGEAKDAAAALIGSGDIRAAAKLYQEVDLLDDALHLLLNVLELPGEAAPLVAALGQPERAAQLYEQAGQKERAAASWLEVAQSAAQPETYLDRLLSLSEPLTMQFLERITEARALGPDSVELHYRLAVLREKRGDRERAMSGFVAIRERLGDYQDVAQHISTLGANANVAIHTIVRGQRVPAPPPSISDQALLELMFDAAARAARHGPSAEALGQTIAGAPCDLGNIEVFYRLGLAHVAGGQWSEARAAFKAVESACPGYRDAQQRALGIEAWKAGIASRKTSEEAKRYALLGELGRGARAVVYRAHDQVRGHDVALKFLSEEPGRGGDARDRFQREVRAVAEFDHPNIAKIYDVGALDGRAFIAMEYLEGQTVQQLFADQKRLAVRTSLDIAVQLLDALEYAHRRKISHLDVKPSNLMRTPDGRVKVMDFGLSESKQEGRGGALPDPRLEDLSAAGELLYTMLAGGQPWQDGDRSRPPARPSALNRSVPELLDQLLLKALASDPELGFQSAAAFAAPLRQLIAIANRLAPEGGAPR
jgi:predicted Ser/Thr protein kinase